MEQDDGTCACESPCDGLACGGEEWVAVVDYNRQAGKSECICAAAAGYAGYLRATQPRVEL